MSHAPDVAMTEVIVQSIIKLYANKAELMHFRFAGGCISFVTLLGMIVPCIADINWPVDKDELGRVWHFMYLMLDRVSGLAMDDCMPHGATRCASEKVILHRTYFLASLSRLTGRLQPYLASLHLHPDTGLQVAPASEIRLLAFKSVWFLSTEPYLKRFRVLKEAVITTLFIAKKITWNAKTRYTLTWLPHAHLQAKIVQKRYTGSWGCVSQPTKNIWKRRPNPKRPVAELTTLLFNVRDTHGSHVPGYLFWLLATEMPKLLIITGTGASDEILTDVTKSLGYTKVIRQNSDESLQNGFMVIWNPLEITVEGHPSYDDTKHLRIQVGQPKTKKIVHKLRDVLFR